MARTSARFKYNKAPNLSERGFEAGYQPDRIHFEELPACAYSGQPTPSKSICSLGICRRQGARSRTRLLSGSARKVTAWKPSSWLFRAMLTPCIPVVVELAQSRTGREPKYLSGRYHEGKGSSYAQNLELEGK